MIRYITRPSQPRAALAEDEWWEQDRRTMDVIHVSDAPIDTGLVDQDGTPILRVMARDPIGLCR